MKRSDFYYDLPEELIAQTPIEPRNASRLMVLDRNSGKTEHTQFTDLFRFLKQSDLLVLNDTKVLPARIFGKRTDTGSEVEISVQNILFFVICQMLCHMSVATFAVFVTGMIRNSSASMAVNFIFMFFGYLGLRSLMKVISFDFDISLL